MLMECNMELHLEKNYDLTILSILIKTRNLLLSIVSPILIYWKDFYHFAHIRVNNLGEYKKERQRFRETLR